MSNSVPAAPDQGRAPPLPHRRPRVREVPSRFMSPAPSPVSSAGDLHSTMRSPRYSGSTLAPDQSMKPPSSQRRLLLRSQAPEPFSSHENIPETTRSMETPFQYTRPESVRRQRNGYGFGDQNQIPKSSFVRTSKSSSRPDTPIVQSRFRQPQQQRQSSSSVTDAAKLLQSFSSSNNESQTDSESESIRGGSCPNSPISSRSSSVTDENTTTNTSSTRSLVRSSSGSSSIISSTSFQTSSSSSLSTPSLCSRSLNSLKSIERSICRPSPGTVLSTEQRVLPPLQPASTKLGVDAKKGKKPQSSQQDMHSLRLLHNKYLQWRFANAKAEASVQAQRTKVEEEFFSVGTHISYLRDKVKKKQAELAALQRTKALLTILESQMPYLDEWSDVEENYTRSLEGAITALTNSSLRLPISGNVQVNVKDVAEAMDSAVKTADMIFHQMQMFLPKAEEMDGLMSELATAVDVEKTLVDECGNLLAKTHTLQVEDCSLRSHLIQVASLNNNRR